MKTLSSGRSNVKLPHTAINYQDPSKMKIFKLRIIYYMENTTRLLDSLKNIYIHTYIIGHYNPSVRIIDLVPHTTYVVCVNFIHKWRDLQF